MIWLHQEGFALDHSVFVESVRRGNLPAIKWCYEKGILPPESVFAEMTYVAASTGDVEIMECLKDKGFPLHPDVDLVAVSSDWYGSSVAMCEWLRQNGVFLTRARNQLIEECWGASETRRAKHKLRLIRWINATEMPEEREVVDLVSE